MKIDQPGTKKFRRSSWILALIGVVWIVATGLGLRKMLNYEDGPSEAGTPPIQWPQESSIPRTPGLPTVVVLAHPRCPCTNATIGELSILMTRLQGKATAVVIFIRPKNFAEGWELTDLWQSAANIPGVRVFSDLDGEEAKRFGAQVSGQTMLYDADGRLQFSGGITASRGHSGDNVGRSAIVSLVTKGSAQAMHASVYGCSLHNPTARSDKGEIAWLKNLWISFP